MRYSDGGGLSAVGRAAREKVRLHAAQMFEQDVRPVQVARRLRVSTKSACQWRRRWRVGGEAALASKAVAGRARLSTELDKGPAAQGWDEDQQWTLARVTMLIGQLFHVR